MRMRRVLIVLFGLLWIALSGCAGINTKTAEEHYRQASALIASEDYSQAIKQMERAEGLGMRGMAFYYNLGVAYSYQQEGFSKSEAAYMEALKYTHEAEEKERKHYLPYIHYNLASLYALENSSDEAFSHLFHAVNAGFRNYHLIATDNELDNLRAHPYFEQLKSATRERTPLPPPPHLPPLPMPPPSSGAPQ